jgi:hypothetical protein
LEHAFDSAAPDSHLLVGTSAGGELSKGFGKPSSSSIEGVLATAEPVAAALCAALPSGEEHGSRAAEVGAAWPPATLRGNRS